MKIISFIIPVYNNEKYLSYAIDSILCQNTKNIEIVIVDDGSTDKSGDIADKYAVKYNFIKVIHQVNQWIYASFNNGIKEAEGEYIYILNSDDRIEGNVIDKMLNVVNQYHPDVVWTTLKIFDCYNDERGRIPREKIRRGFERIKFWNTPTDIHGIWPYLYKCGLVISQSNLYKRELALKHPFNNKIYGADTLFNIDIARDIKSMVSIPDDCYEHNVYVDEKNMNVSVKNFYPYEHDMFNSFFILYRDLFSEWNLSRDSYYTVIIKRRLICITAEIRHMKAENCNYSLNEKIYRVLNNIPDDLIISIMTDNNDREELESRSINGIRELLDTETLTKDDSMYFVQELRDALESSNKESIKEKFDIFINHELNPRHFGRFYLRRVIEENKYIKECI